MRRLECRAQ
uniref:Uncharacterized protein n=1 Tax=Rhizophora mucronata TaxID=61149 RepID=A0A2P2P945_RHIMU